MTIREDFEKEFETMIDGGPTFALSRRRLRLSERPSVHGVLYFESEDLTHALPRDEMLQMTGFTEEELGDNRPLMVTLGYVAPGFLPKDNIKTLWEGMDWRAKEHQWQTFWLVTCELAVHYGYGVPSQWKFMIEETGEEDIAWALEEMHPMESLCGFYLDRPVNRVGSTGWDFLRGDCCAGLRRWKEEQENKEPA